MSEIVPTREVDVDPVVHIDMLDAAPVEELAWTDRKQILIIQSENPHWPLNNVEVRVDGSSRRGGEFGFGAQIGLDCMDQDIHNFITDFLLQFDSRDIGDHEGKSVLSDSEGNSFLMSVEEHNEFGPKLFLRTCAACQPDSTETGLGELRHGDVSFGEAFEAYRCILEELLAGIYRTKGQAANLKLVTEPPEELPPPETNKVESKYVRPKTFADIGGYDHIKSQIMDMVDTIRHPEIMDLWGADRLQGMLLYGPPGTGKTTLVEAAATELGAELISVKHSDIYDMWLGNSEKNMQKIIDKALAVTEPTILLFDEIEGIIHSDNHSIHQAVTSIFKRGTTRLATENPYVLLAATTNHTSKMEPAILRAGRFDVKLYVDLPDEPVRKAIFGQKVEEYMLDSRRHTFDLEELDFRQLAKASEGLSGSDINKIVKGLIAAKALRELREGAIPPPISQEELIRAIAQHRRTFDTI